MQTKNNSMEVVFNIEQSLYPKEALYAACYVFLDRFYIFLDKEKNRIKVILKSKKEEHVDSSSIKGEFMNELLNNALRLSISKRTRRIKEIIVKEALFFSNPKKEIDNRIFTANK